jgi:ankyrin repeat protein
VIELFPDYETFLTLCSRLGSSLRRAQSLREEIDSTAWVLDHSIFQKWLENEKFPILFIGSPPGFGSTILSSSVPSLIELERRKHGIHFEMYLSFSFNRWDTRCDSERSFVASIIHQALTLRPKLFRHIRGVCTLISEQHLHSISCDRLWSLFRQILFESQERCVFLIVNSVDQCREPAAGEPSIVERLSSLTKDNKTSGRVKILVTGRPQTETIESCKPLYINLPDDPAWKAGIRNAVSKRILHIASMRPVWKDYTEDITNKFCCGDYNYFNTMLRVKLLESTKIPSTRASLQLNVPIQSMNQVFYTLLSNLENQEMANEALNWIYHATRPLTVSELSVAIALTSICNGEKADEPMLKEVESRLTVLEEAISWDPKRDLQGLIGNVIKVVGNMGEVCLTHSTFRQYFENSEFFIPQFHEKIARRCLTYMSTVTEYLAKSSDSSADKTRVLALLGYADINWTMHYKLSTHPVPQLDSKVMEFLWQDEAAAWFKRLKPAVSSDLPITDPLVMAAEGGLTSIVMALLRPPFFIIEESIKAALETSVRRDDSHIYGLLLPHLLQQKLAPYVCLAAEYGNTGLVTQLLSQMDSEEREALAKKEVPLPESPTLLAAQNGHMKTLIAILDKLPETAIKQVDRLTLSNVFNWAAAWGDSETLETLHSRKGLKADSMTSQDSNKGSLLRLAAQSGCLDAVEFVLRFADQDAIEQKDDKFLNALHVASLEGHVAIVKRLIKAGADVMAMGDRNKCSLEFAADEGHLPVFCLLLKEMDQQSQKEMTGGDSKKETFLMEHLHKSLLNAISHGHTDIIHHILSQNNRMPEKDPELMDSAVRSGHLGAIKTLVDVDIKLQETEEEGESLLRKAISDGRVNIVRYLVGAGIKVKADPQYLDGEVNILHDVAESGNRPVMRELLLLPQSMNLLQASNYVGDKPLDVAVQFGHEGVAKELLKKSNLALLGLRKRRPFRTLFRAIEGGRVEIVNLLFARNWEVDCRDADSNTPLHKATLGGHAEIAKLFFNNKKILNEKNAAGDTPLHIAVSKRNLEMFRLLLDHQGDPNMLGHDGFSVLHVLCRQGGYYPDEWLGELLSPKVDLETPKRQRERVNIDLRSSVDRTALHYAIISEETTKVILNQTPTVDAVDTETQETPLMLASELDKAGVINLLLKAKAEPNKRNKAGKSALDIAIESDLLPNVQALVEGGADVNSRKNENDPTPLYVAVSKSSLPIVSYLLTKGADPNMFGGDFYSPLELAAYQEEKEIVKALLEKKDINIDAGSAEHGIGSVLHAALISRSQDIFDLIMEKGANANATAMPYVSNKPLCPPC